MEKLIKTLRDIYKNQIQHLIETEGFHPDLGVRFLPFWNSNVMTIAKKLIAENDGVVSIDSATRVVNAFIKRYGSELNYTCDKQELLTKADLFFGNALLDTDLFDFPLIIPTKVRMSLLWAEQKGELVQNLLKLNHDRVYDEDIKNCVINFIRKYEKIDSLDVLVCELDRRLVVSVQNLLRDKNISGDTYRRIRSDWDKKKNDIARRLVQYNQQSDDKVITLTVEKFIHDYMEHTPDSLLTQEKNTDESIKILTQQVTLLTQQVEHLLSLTRPFPAFPQGYRSYSPFQKDDPQPTQPKVPEDIPESTSPSVAKTDTTEDKNKVVQDCSGIGTSWREWYTSRCRELVVRKLIEISQSGNKMFKRSDLTTKFAGIYRADQLQEVLDELVIEGVIELIATSKRIKEHAKISRLYLIVWEAGRLKSSIPEEQTTYMEEKQRLSEKALGGKKKWADDRCRAFILKSFMIINRSGDKVVKKGDLTAKLSGKCHAAQIQRVLDQLVSEKIISLLPDKNKLTKRYRLHKQFAE